MSAPAGRPSHSTLAATQPRCHRLPLLYFQKIFQKFVVQVHPFSEAAMLWRHHPCPALHTHLAGQTVAVVVCRYGKVSRAGTNREPTSGGRHVSVRCGWSGRAQMPHLLHGWRGDHRLGTLLSVVSFPGTLLDGTSARPAGPQWHRLLRAHLTSSFAPSLSAATGKLYPPHLVPPAPVRE